MPADLPKLPLQRVPYTRHAAFYGLVLLVLWAAFWVASFNQFQLVGWRDVSFWAWSFLGLDFYHNYHGARAWLAGLNPYVDDIGDPRGPYAYPPVVLPMFAWSRFFDFQVATAIWAACVAAAIAWGVRVVQQTRRANGLPFLSAIFVTALMVWSMPVIFAMERGNGDVIVLVCMIGVIIAWRRSPSLLTDAVIGGCMALAAWVKVYPLALFGVLVLTARWRALLLGIAIFAVIGLMPLEYTKGFLAASKNAQGQRSDTVGAAVDWLRGRPMRPLRPEYAPIEYSSHSLTTYWPALAEPVGLHRVPGLIAAAVFLFPLGAWVTWAFWRSPQRERWLAAFMLWFIALVTFWMPVSYDYNLFFLPLAMWAVWDHRDGWVANLAMAAAILWWQPLRPPEPISPAVLFWVKVASLIVVAQVLVKRLRQDAAPSVEFPVVPASAKATLLSDNDVVPSEQAS